MINTCADAKLRTLAGAGFTEKKTFFQEQIQDCAKNSRGGGRTTWTMAAVRNKSNNEIFLTRGRDGR